MKDFATKIIYYSLEAQCTIGPVVVTLLLLMLVWWICLRIPTGIISVLEVIEWIRLRDEFRIWRATIRNKKPSKKRVAVFCRTVREFRDFDIPNHELIRITGLEDIQGITFCSVVTIGPWFSGHKDILEAYHCLEIRQPELFK